MKETKKNSKMLRISTIFAIIIFAIFFIHFTFFSQVYSRLTQMRITVGMVVILFIILSVPYIQDSYFNWPHPLVFKLAKAISLLYLGFVSFLLFLSREEARKVFLFFDSSLGKPLVEFDYAQSCDIYTPNDPTSNFRNVKNVVLDVYVLAHLLGWFVKTLIFRDIVMLWGISIVFEFLEITFQHLLENLSECWWDHIIVDALGCNAIAMFVGMWVIKKAKLQKFHWFGHTIENENEKDNQQKSKPRFLSLSWFSQTWKNYHWDMFDSPKKFFAAIFLFSFAEISELNVFFMKYPLWIPPEHPLNPIRLIIFALSGVETIKEFYEYINTPNSKYHFQMYISFLVVIIETILGIKFGQGLYPRNMPTYIRNSWIIFFLVFGTSSFIHFYRKNKSLEKTSPKNPKEKF